MRYIKILLVLTEISYTLSNNLNIPLTKSWSKKKIVESTIIEEHPYHVSIERGAKHIFRGCSGILIKENVILTAAHCSQETMDSYQVRAGTNVLEKGGEVASVVKVCTHPKYENWLDIDYDVSVWLLSNAFNSSTKIGTIKLQPINETVSNNRVGIVTSWNRISRVLEEAQISKVDDKICQWYYPFANGTEHVTCYGFVQDRKSVYRVNNSYYFRKKIKVFKGHHSVPLVVDNILIGISSFMNYSEPHQPAVFIKIANEETQNHINSCLENFTKIIKE